MSHAERGNGIRLRRLVLGGMVTILGGLAPAGTSQSATIKLPVYDQRIEHPEPSTTDMGEEPVFGYTMLMGDVDSPGPSSRDDLIVASFHKDGVHAVDAGKVYLFAGPNLGQHSLTPAVSPAVAGGYQTFGRLGMDLADVVGLASDPDDELPLLFVPVPGRKMTGMSSCGGDSTIDVGAVDVFDASSGPTSVMTITPPPIPGESPALPCDVRWFGHWITHGDIDGDNYDDLIVGAPNADDEVGRVYIFFGHPDFLSPSGPGYTERWMILRPPPAPDPETGFVADRQFGACVSAADLDDDGKADLLVGSPERAIRIGSQHGPGRAFLFHGYWLASQLYYEETFADVTPPEPTELEECEECEEGPPYPPDIDRGVGGIYETLIDPRPGDFRATPGRQFGWILSMKCGDLGQPVDPEDEGWVPDFDDRPDILIHSEAALGYGVDEESIVGAGALFAFMNDSVPESDETLVDEAVPVTLMTPRIFDEEDQPVYYPDQGTRFGRGFAVADWEKSNGSPTRVLFVGEPERSIVHPVTSVGVGTAGVVYAFELPLDPHFNPNDLEADHINAWGGFVLLEPAENLTQNNEEDLSTASHLDPRAGSLWGGWLVSGHYDLTFPGEQLVISARARDVTVGSTTYPGLGRVYAVTLPTD